MTENLVRCLAAEGEIVALALDSADIAARAERIHRSSATVTAALGRLLTAASLMGAMLKTERGSVTLRVDGDGPAGLLLAVADPAGNVKGFAQNPAADLPRRPDGKLNVGGAVGRGKLSVVKDLGLKEPFVGTVELVSGEIAEDIAAYFAYSEQIPSVCALGVLVNPDLTVKAAGGFLVQLLPFASESTIAALEKNLSGLPSVTEMLTAGLDPEGMLQTVLAGLNPQMTERRRADYVCDCGRERTAAALRSLPKAELEELAESGEPAQVCCDFCGAAYRFSPDELREMAKNKKI